MPEQKDLFGDEIHSEERRKNARETPHKPTPLSRKGKAIAQALEPATVEYLKGAYESFTGWKPPKGRKTELIQYLASFLDFTDRTEFDRWFGALPPHLKTAIEQGTFHPLVDAFRLSKESGVDIVIEKKEFGSYRTITFADASRMWMFSPVDRFTIRMPYPFRLAFRDWLPKPPGWEVSPVIPGDDRRYRVEERIEEVLPLAFSELSNAYPWEIAVSGVGRSSDRRRFQQRCGIVPFPVAQKLGLYAGDLLARFVACFGWPHNQADPARGKAPAESTTTDPEQWLKMAVDRFFSRREIVRPNDVSRGINFEYRALLPHLTKSFKGSFYDTGEVPISRMMLRNCLSGLKAGEWYDTEALFVSVEYRSEGFSPFENNDWSHDLKLKGDQLVIGDSTYSHSSWESYFPSTGILHRELVGLPLFRAYCYLFAAFGLLETAESEPAMRLERNGKQRPISPFDGLEAVKITPVGAWCFGFSSERPARIVREAIVLADSELPILTIQGDALEKRLYLERIGVQLGPERYRVTETSFIAGCDSLEKIEERIERFYALVSKDPPELWKHLIDSVRTKSQIFRYGEQAVVFELPADERIRSLFFTSAALSSLVIKAEGGRIVCREKDLKRLQKALAAEGFLPPSPDGWSTR